MSKGIGRYNNCLDDILALTDENSKSYSSEDFIIVYLNLKQTINILYH